MLIDYVRRVVECGVYSARELFRIVIMGPIVGKIPPPHFIG